MKKSAEKKLKLSDLQREILVGVLLGDAHLETRSNGRTFRIKFEQSIKKNEYMIHLYEVFKEWTSQAPKEKRQNVYFQTISHPVFRFYGHQFYKEKKKVVPKQLFRWLTNRSFAYWYMDDGSIKSKESKGLVLNTQAFTLQEVETLCRIIGKKFGFQAKPRRQLEGYQVYISGRSYNDFVKSVVPFVHPSMMYKIPAARKT